MDTAALLHRVENGRTDLVEPLLGTADGQATLQAHGAKLARRPTEVLRPLLYGPHRIHAGNRPLRANLLGTPVIDET
jgi:hypothetical protein